jgi:hypothetical protein
VLIVYLLGPGPSLEYDAQDNPMYEGTPVHLLILPGGLFVEVAIHSTISYFILCAAFKRHADQS